VQVQRKLAVSIIGSPDTVNAGIERLVNRTQADELMVVSDIFDHSARLRSFELIATAARPRARV
jgi:alkanesulfonate monooxygenase SsuD/methylene tetrahydromethanopterin reductase-like flavin-dependent oxidoreductase (luciferase family)